MRLVVPPAGPIADLYARVLIAGDRFGKSDDLIAADAARLQLVARDPLAVTVVPIATAAAHGARLLAIDGEPPSLGAARCGRYPFASPVVIGYRDGQSARVASFFVDLRRASARSVLGESLCID